MRYYRKRGTFKVIDSISQPCGSFNAVPVAYQHEKELKVLTVRRISSQLHEQLQRHFANKIKALWFNGKSDLSILQNKCRIQDFLKG